jgi:hypothetical protein
MNNPNSTNTRKAQNATNYSVPYRPVPSDSLAKRKFVALYSLSALLTLTVFLLLAFGSIGILAWIPIQQIVYQSTLTLTAVFCGMFACLFAYSLRPAIWPLRAKRAYGASSVSSAANEALHQDEDWQFLDPKYAPGLYKVAKRVIGKLDVSAPINIHITTKYGVVVHVQRDWMGRIEDVDIGVGLPLFGTMTESELGSLIAHGFGYDMVGDGPLKRINNAVKRWMRAIVTELDDSLFPPDFIWHFLAKWFLRLSAIDAHVDVYFGDSFASKHFGPIATRCALEKTFLIGPMWTAYFETELTPAMKHGARMPIFEGFRLFCKPGQRRPDVLEALKRAESRVYSEFDFPPTLQDRIDGLTFDDTPSYPPIAQCMHLIGSERALEDIWYALYGAENLTHSNWVHYATHVLPEAIKKRFADTWLDPAEKSFVELIKMTHRPEEWWERLRPPGVSYLSQQAKRDYILDTISEWTIACLLFRGFTPRVIPAQALIMQREDAAVVPAIIVQAGLNGKLRSTHLNRYDVVSNGQDVE